MKLQCLTVDDEQGAHLVLKNYIARIESLELVGMCYDTVEALNFLHKNKVDILFLDISMPEMTGLEMLQTLRNPPKVILTTAYSEFALESYEYGVHDYLIKPIPFPRFLRAINRIIDERKEPQAFQNSEPTNDSYLFVQADAGQVRIDFDDIIYVQSWGNYIKIFTPTQTHLASLTTQEIEEKLPPQQFIRIHRSYLIARRFIGKIMGNQAFIQNQVLPIGTTFRQKVMEWVKM
jgi:DNA-binding LytR/AlgR family response regulator